jgi:hypothetical protein
MSAAALAWKLDLEITTNEGWTGYGQTNELLRFMAVYGVVFLGLEGEELAAYVKETAIASPGYKQWCRHQHEIEDRAKEWVKQVQKDGYYLKYRNFPKRLQTYYQKFRLGKNNVVKHTRANPGNRVRATDAHERIRTVVTSLKDHNIYPDTIQGRAEVITVTAGVSRQTLYKDSNLPLWHPRFDELPDPWYTPPTTCAWTPPEWMSPVATQLCLPPASEPLPAEPDNIVTTHPGLGDGLKPLPGEQYTLSPEKAAKIKSLKPLPGEQYTQSCPNEGLNPSNPGTGAPQGSGSQGLPDSDENSSSQPPAPGGDRQTVPSVTEGQSVTLRGQGNGTVQRLTEWGTMVIRLDSGLVTQVAFWATAFEQGVIGFPNGDNLVDAELEAKAEAARRSLLKASIAVRQMQWRNNPRSHHDIRKWAQSTPGVKMTDDGPVADDGEPFGSG